MWYALLLAACIAGDQLLKYWVVRHLEIGQSAAFLPGLVRLTRLHNTGAAWSSARPARCARCAAPAGATPS